MNNGNEADPSVNNDQIAKSSENQSTESEVT